MLRQSFLAGMVSLGGFGVLWAQETETETKMDTQEVTVTETQEQPAPPAPDYGGSIWERSKMTGDWGGARTELANHGITFDIDYTQIFQQNAHGGADTNNGARLSGSGDITLTLDTGKMGLWPGGSFVLVGEPVWGGGVNNKVGSLLPVNFDAAKPGSAEPDWGLKEGGRMLLSEWFFQQVMFDGKAVFVAGKLFGARAFDRNAFANDERTQFMSTGLRNNIPIPTFLPYTTLGAAIVLNPTDWLSVMTAVADTDGRAKTTGFETAFHGDTNTTVIHEWAFTINPFDRPGHQRIGFVWSSKDFQKLTPPTPFKQTADMVIDLLGPDLANEVVNMLADFDTAVDNIMVYYNFDQYLWQDEGDPSQGVGIFGRFAWARQDVNPVAHYYSFGVGGTGVLPERDRDTLGIGYYYVDLSNDLPTIFHSEQGIEAYYNIEVTPWLHISPDLQVIVNPGGTDLNDVSVVYGIRMHMNL
jgi:porin